MGRNQATTKVLVSRIPKTVNKSDIHSLCSTFGNITACENKVSENDKGEHYKVLVTFEAPEQAQQAVRNLAGYPYDGSVLRIDYFNENQQNGNSTRNNHFNRRQGPVARGPPARGNMAFGPHYGPPQAPTAHHQPRDIPLRILVLSDMVGAIIGKSGATIKQITQQSRARVDVHRKEAAGFYNQGNMEKVITIYGSPENCSTACKKILEVMQQEATTGENGHKQEEPIVLKLLAHSDLIGRIIGRAGATIKRVMDATEAKISVSAMPGDPRERVITIKGDLEEMCKAEQQISAKLRQCFESDMQQAAMSMPPLPPPPPPPPQMMGYPQHTHPAAAFRPPHHPHPHPPPYGPMGVPGPSGHFYPPGDGAVESTHVWVPSCTVGAIIGTGGAAIREMIGVSGCTIKVAQTKDDAKSTLDNGILSVAPSSTASGGAKVEIIEMKNEKIEKIEEKKTKKDDPKDKPTTSAHTGQNQNNIGITPAPYERRVTLTGSPEAQWKAQCMLFRKVFFDGYQHIQASTEAASSPTLQMGHLRVEIAVPSNQVGRIIGKGGQTVKELQRLTRALIKLPEEVTNEEEKSKLAIDSETPVHIIGDFYGTQAAQRQIRALVARNGTTPASAATGGLKKAAVEGKDKTQKVEGDCNKSESHC